MSHTCESENGFHCERRVFKKVRGMSRDKAWTRRRETNRNVPQENNVRVFIVSTDQRLRNWLPITWGDYRVVGVRRGKKVNPRLNCPITAKYFPSSKVLNLRRVMPLLLVPGSKPATYSPWLWGGVTKGCNGFTDANPVHHTSEGTTVHQQTWSLQSFTNTFISCSHSLLRPDVVLWSSSDIVIMTEAVASCGGYKLISVQLLQKTLAFMLQGCFLIFIIQI